MTIIPTIPDDAEDVVGLPGRIRLQKGEDSQKGSQFRDRNWMDKQRQNLQAYEYLCHIGEAKEWIQDCIGETIEPTVELEEALRTGIALAKLAKWFAAPGTVKKIFLDKKLQFRHSDNINFFFKAIKQVQLPQIFWFELTDLYERKNIPKVIYCIHALSHLLARRGLAPTIKNLVGQLEFTIEELRTTQLGLDRSGVTMPAFNNVKANLRRELNEPDFDDEYEEEAEESPVEEDAYEVEELIMESSEVESIKSIEAEESDEEPIEEEFEEEVFEEEELTEEERFNQYWSDPRNQYLLRKAQSFVRTYLLRKDFLITQEIHRWAIPLVTAVQAHCRGVLVRNEFHSHIEDMRDLEDFAIRLQAHARGALTRKRISERLEWFQMNEAKVIKIQSFFRSKVQGEKYRKLTLGKNPTTGTVKDFIHLLDDNDFDLEEELEIQRGKQTVVRKIRENTALDSYLNELDIKIALLVKNRITLEEVVKLSKTMSKKEQRRMSVAMAQGTYALGNNPANIFSLQSLDKEAHDQLELYQNLFYLLQTQPSYLARLLYVTGEKSNPKERKAFQTFVLSMFGHAQDGREEYLLLKLFQYSIREEIARCETVQEFMRGNYGFLSLVLQYNRGAKERKYLRELLRPLVKHIIDSPELDLSTNPVIIYHKSIAAEESETGMQSARPIDVTPEQAIMDPQTQSIFAKHLYDLRETTERFLVAITSSLKGMPYGIRFIAGELARALKGKFREESEDALRRVVGNFVYYRYLNPSLVAPEMFDVVEELIPDPVRKNLGEVSRILQMAATGKIFYKQEEQHFMMLNEYLNYASQRLGRWFDEVPRVSALEAHFDINPWTDMTAVDKPTIWISPTEIFSVHSIIYENLNDLAPNPNDPLHEIITELGPPPEFDVSDPLIEQSMQGEISLRLTNRYQNIVQAPDAAVDHLFMETKREVLYVMKVQSGPHLLEILLRHIRDEEEALWDQIRKEDDHDSALGASSEEDNVGSLDGRLKKAGNRMSMPGRKSTETMGERRKKVFHNGGYRDIRSMRFVELKAITLENMIKLEMSGRVTRKNNFQDMVNSIAIDITNKHRRRVQRQKELRTIRQTLINLDEKRYFLDETKETYLAYLDSCMNQLTSRSNRRRSRLVIPFTRQYYHLRDLQRNGRVPKFGSYVYTAKQLYDKGVLISIEGVSPKQYDKITLTISSNATGEFKVEASLQALGVSAGKEVMDLRFEDLLSCQFNGVLSMNLFDGAAKVNVNLLIFLVNKKFYT